jgi:lyso-ornithine lipid O-acyltransferase
MQCARATGLGMLKLILRVLAIIAFVLLFLPVQWLCVHFGWRLRSEIPCLFERFVVRILGIKVEIRGQLSDERPLLLVSNHISWLDIMVIGSLAPLSFIAKAEVANWPVFGFLSRMQRTVFVDRARRMDTQSVNRSIADRLEDGDIMVLFPEGTTSDGTRLLPYKSALIGAAREAGGADSVVTVQNVTLAYTRRGGLPLSVFQRAEEVAWAGDVDLLPHLIGILKGAPVDVVVQFGESRAFGPQTDRKALTRQLETETRVAMENANRNLLV